MLAGLEIRNGDAPTIRLGTAEKKCELQTILEKTDAVSFALQKKFPALLRGGDVGKIRFAALEPVCLEKYSEIPQLGRFVIEGKKLQVLDLSLKLVKSAAVRA